MGLRSSFAFLNCVFKRFLAGSAYRECMDNGTWALKSNYSNCEPILEEKVSAALTEQSCCHVLEPAEQRRSSAAQEESKPNVLCWLFHTSWTALSCGAIKSFRYVLLDELTNQYSACAALVTTQGQTATLVMSSWSDYITYPPVSISGPCSIFLTYF